jgi:hypothetical protein
MTEENTQNTIASEYKLFHRQIRLGTTEYGLT